MFNSSTVLTPASSNPMKDFEVDSPPDDSISCMAFSPATVPQNFLVAGSWDSSVRCWEIDPTGKSVAKSIQSMTGPVLDVCWSDDGSKVFMASCDKMVKCWDLVSNQAVQVASHDAPIKTCHWIKGSNYSCLMTGSWDKTLKFWDTRSPNPMLTLNLPDRCYCADVDYPYAVVGTPGKELLVYKLEGTPQEHKKIPSSLTYAPRCIAIFRDKKNAPSGYAVGNISGRIAIHNFNATNTRDNFTFKCHRLYDESTRYQEIYAVNDLAFHPVHGTLVTVGGDGIFTFWDKDSRSKLKSSESMGQPITTCCFNHDGQILAYSVSYDWSKGHEFNNPMQKNCIFLRSCFEELKPKDK